MLFDDKTGETIEQLVAEIKQYISLQREYTKLDVVEKLTVIISTLAMLFIGIALGMMVLFYLLMSLAYLLEPLVGGLEASYAIVAGIAAILLIVVVSFKKRLFIKPLIRFLTTLFFNDSKK